MTNAEIEAQPCGECTAAFCAHESRLEAARAHRVRDACASCGAPVGRWCTCVSRMDAAQPAHMAPEQAAPAQLEMF
jgi:uncharacterized protein (DUF2237 family)